MRRKKYASSATTCKASKQFRLHITAEEETSFRLQGGTAKALLLVTRSCSNANLRTKKAEQTTMWKHRKDSPTTAPLLSAACATVQWVRLVAAQVFASPQLPW